MTREPIYAALFAYFAALTSGGSPLFRTATRSPKHWDSVDPENCPALLMRQRNEIAEHRKFLPTKWTMNLELLIYVHTGQSIDPTIIAAQVLNPLLDAVEASFIVDDIQTNSVTLGGLVNYAAINGATDIYLGSLGNDAVAVVPVRVLYNN
jgi:hypothetical protein